MKKRISATIDDKNERRLDSILKEGEHRNKSHIIDDAIEFYWEANYDKSKK